MRKSILLITTSLIVTLLFVGGCATMKCDPQTKICTADFSGRAKSTTDTLVPLESTKINIPPLETDSLSVEIVRNGAVLSILPTAMKCSGSASLRYNDADFPLKKATSLALEWDAAKSDQTLEFTCRSKGSEQWQVSVFLQSSPGGLDGTARTSIKRTVVGQQKLVAAGTGMAWVRVGVK